MILNESFGHQYAILLRNYGIVFSHAVTVIVNNFKVLLDIVKSLKSSEFLLLQRLTRNLKRDSISYFTLTDKSLPYLNKQTGKRAVRIQHLWHVSNVDFVIFGQIGRVSTREKNICKVVKKTCVNIIIRHHLNHFVHGKIGAKCSE